jgi:hypothetical protein
LKAKLETNPELLKSVRKSLDEEVTVSDTQFKRHMQLQFSLWEKTMDDYLIAKYTNKCASLPELTKKAFRLWFDLAYEIFLYLTDKAPERYGWAGVQQPDGTIMIGQVKHSLRKERDVKYIRRQIKVALRQAFRLQLFKKNQEDTVVPV